MSLQWSDFLLWADEWVNKPAIDSHPEVHYRAIISRAYYAVYHAAEESANAAGFQSTSSASNHFRLREFFENRGRVAGQLSVLLKRLYRWRISADYVIDSKDAVTNNARFVAQQAVDTAHKAMEAITYLQARNK